MAHILIMPRQGNTVESCIITDWYVKEGDTVNAQTIICGVETDKAAFDVPAGADGTVLAFLYKPGDDVPVLAPIAVIGVPGEDWKTALGDTETKIVSAVETKIQDQTDNGSKKQDVKSNLTGGVPFSAACSQFSPISPRARNLASKEALPLDSISGTGPGGRIIERDVKTALQNSFPLTPAAKAAGTIAIPQSGSGLAGRIRKTDLGAAVMHSFPDAGEFDEIKIKGIRKIISDRMFMSLNETAQFTLNSSFSAVSLQEVRSKIKNDSSFAGKIGIDKITVNDLVLFAVSRILPVFPYMNAHKTGDTIKVFNKVHLATAVDTPRGLMVPVIRNANMLSLAKISSESRRLAEACREGTAKPDELSGSTFTVTNLGSLGVINFTPVLNAPEVAILGVGSIEIKPIAVPEGGDKRFECGCMGVRFEPHINFSLTINHQAVDGAPAGRFLKALGEAVTGIDQLLNAEFKE